MTLKYEDFIENDLNDEGVPFKYSVKQYQDKLPDEYFIGNLNPLDNSSYSYYETLRYGDIPYDIYGNKLEDNSGLKPTYVKKQEMIDRLGKVYMVTHYSYQDRDYDSFYQNEIDVQNEIDDQSSLSEDFLYPIS